MLGTLTGVWTNSMVPNLDRVIAVIVNWNQAELTDRMAASVIPRCRKWCW